MLDKLARHIISLHVVFCLYEEVDSNVNVAISEIFLLK